MDANFREDEFERRNVVRISSYARSLRGCGTSRRRLLEYRMVPPGNPCRRSRVRAGKSVRRSALLFRGHRALQGITVSHAIAGKIDKISHQGVVRDGARISQNRAAQRHAPLGVLETDPDPIATSALRNSRCVGFQPQTISTAAE